MCEHACGSRETAFRIQLSAVEVGARGSTRHQLSAGSFTTEPFQWLWDRNIKRPLKQLSVCVGVVYRC